MPTDPKKRAQLQQVELMRMRHRAVPADPKDKPGSVGVDQRLHVKASCRGESEGVEKIFWFRKVTFLFCPASPDCPLTSPRTQSVGTGRALDILARHFNVRTTGVRLWVR